MPLRLFRPNEKHLKWEVFRIVDAVCVSTFPFYSESLSSFFCHSLLSLSFMSQSMIVGGIRLCSPVTIKHEYIRRKRYTKITLIFDLSLFCAVHIHNYLKIQIVIRFAFSFHLHFQWMLTLLVFGSFIQFHRSFRSFSFCMCTVCAFYIQHIRKETILSKLVWALFCEIITEIHLVRKIHVFSTA